MVVPADSGDNATDEDSARRREVVWCRKGKVEASWEAISVDLAPKRGIQSLFPCRADECLPAPSRSLRVRALSSIWTL